MFSHALFFHSFGVKPPSTNHLSIDSLTTLSTVLSRWMDSKALTQTKQVATDPSHEYTVRRVDQAFRIQINCTREPIVVDHLLVSTFPVLDSVFKGDVFIDAPVIQRIRVEGSLTIVWKPETVARNITAAKDIHFIVNAGVKVAMDNVKVGNNFTSDGADVTLINSTISGTSKETNGGSIHMSALDGSAPQVPNS